VRRPARILNVGWLTMILYICGGIAMVGWGLLSDRMNERRWHLLVACTVSQSVLSLPA
jgi:ACS family tartrate transporter-like MFS transporter